MLRHVLEVVITRKHQQVVANAELSKERIKGSGLYAMSTTDVTQFGGVDMVLPFRHQEGQCRKPLNDLLSRFRPGKTLQEFLQDEAGGQDRVPVLEHPDQCHDLCSRGGPVTAQRKRPHAGIDENAQSRERSDL